MLLAAMVAGLGFGRQRSGSPLSVVRAHTSNYVIYYDIRAAPSIVEAAVDLRDHVARATGVALPIVNAAEAPLPPFIALGDTRESRNAGVTIDGMPPDSFVIAPRGRNVFIVGPDSGKGERLESGGTSAGTANGVYAFLERYVDVRWLMPGDAGADIPKRADVLVPVDDDVREAPTFAYRRVPYIQNDNAAVAQWSRRQRLGYSLALNHGHNWEAIGPELFETHPDWFAASNGHRLKPGNPYKLETTNPALVQAFAAKAIEAFRRDPNLRSFSLSPSDGSGGWSDSPESAALYDKDPHGALSVTPLILKFYNDVAWIVGRQFPDRLLCGYVYAQYLYPPSAGIPPMEPNVCLVVAPSIDYGYQLFRPGVRQDFAGAAQGVGTRGAHDGVLRFAVPAPADAVSADAGIGAHPRFRILNRGRVRHEGRLHLRRSRLGLRRRHELSRGQACLEPVRRRVRRRRGVLSPRLRAGVGCVDEAAERSAGGGARAVLSVARDGQLQSHARDAA